MAPSVEYLDGPSNVMPRPDLEHAAAHHDANSTALVLSWQEPAFATRIKDIVGSIWYGRATPA